MGCVFYAKVIHVHVYEKVEYSFAIFWFNAILGLDL